MKAISNSSDCPSCGSEHKAKPFCLYDNGYHCFSCGYTKTSDRSYAPTYKSISKPPDWPQTKSIMSVHNQKWLAQYYVTQELINKYNIYTSEDDALLFPDIQDGEIVSYQKRYNTTPRRVTHHGNKIPKSFKAESRNDIVILVEDYVSAIRINNIGYNVICLWGTKINYDLLKEVLKYYKTTVTWLDNDSSKEVNSGQEAAKKIRQMSESLLYSVNVHKGYNPEEKHRMLNIATKSDPKCYSDSRMDLIITNAGVSNGYNE